MFKSVISVDAKVADVIRNDPERDCRKYNIKARAREIFTALDVDKNGLVSFRKYLTNLPTYLCYVPTSFLF